MLKVRRKGKPIILATLLAWLLGIVMIPGAQTASAAPVQQTSFTGIVEICTVVSATLNVRSGPGTGNMIIANPLQKGQKVVVFASQSGWVRHGNGGWSASSSGYMSCAKLTRTQVTKAMIPSGYTLHETATLHVGGRAPQYDVITAPNGESFQPWLPLEGQRQGHDVAISLPAGTYVFKGVACYAEEDTQKAGDNAQRTEKATHQNDGVFTVTAEANWLRVVCDASDVSGFAVVLGGNVEDSKDGTGSNSPYGSRESFVPNEAAGQWLMLAYDLSGNRLPAFDAVKESNGDVWQPWLPDEATRKVTAFEVALVALDTTRAATYYTFNGIVCNLWLDEKLEGKGNGGRLAAARGNVISFEVDLYMNEIADKGEAWGLVRCDADPHNGFSLRWHEN